MARQEALRLRIRVDDARATLAAFRGLPKEANKALRDKSLELSQLLASRVSSAARSDSAQSALLAPTVKAKKDRLPAITVGGAKRVGRNRKPAHKILFGSEFGSSLPQFRPHIGRGSYWLFKSVEAEEATISRKWNEAADEVLRAFGRSR